MEADREFKHVCKFCSKSFPYGRSLGGHMRSHMINDISAQTDGTMVTKKKLPHLNNNDGANSNNNNTLAENSAYGLRETRKKKWRFADHSRGDNSRFDKFCKECGKIFQSWKALFGHMKCHSQEKEKLSNDNNSLEEQQDSWTGNNSQKLVMDSQSDNETAAPNRKKRSKRRIRYMGTANSSSLSFPNNASFCASEIEQEQEEVALCLMMLSRDVGQRGGLNSVAESSDTGSEFMEPNRVYSKNEVNISITNGVDPKQLMEFIDKKFQIGKSQCEDSKLEVSRSEFAASEISRKGFIKNDKSNKSRLGLDDQSGVKLIESSIKQPGLNQVEMLSKKCNSSKRKSPDTFDPELKSDSLKKPPSSDLVDSEVCKNSDKSSIFECAACNKVFHSYQALGGHRASHKKIRGCFASKIDSSENSIETELSPDPTADSKLITSTTNGIKIDVPATDCDNKTQMNFGAKKNKRHECPVCLRVFPSGQALGGHKRSHLIGGTEAKSNQTSTIQEPNPAIRDFLDLNLPAPGEEESNGLVGFKNSWWIGSSHKHEALVGLISN